VDVVATLIELKPRSSEAIEAWAAYVAENRAAAEETLRAEGVTIESWFEVSIGGKEYLLCYMRAASIRAAHEVARQSQNPVDAYHQEFKRKAWVKGENVNGRLLVDLVAQTVGVSCERSGR
jgi:uncharacterized protein DUF6176